MKRLHANLIIIPVLTNTIISSSVTNALHFTNDARTKGRSYKLHINCCNKLVFILFFISCNVCACNSLPDEYFKLNSIQSF